MNIEPDKSASNEESHPYLSKIACFILGKIHEYIMLDFPPVVRIETTNACNARCTICPHQKMERSIKYMSEELYLKLINECSKHKCHQVHLHNFGEPLLDKTLENKIKLAKEQGISKVKIFSNGSLLTPERATKIIESGLDEIKISVDGATKEEFESIRKPLKFDVVINNIFELVKIRNSMKSKMRIIVNCVSTSDKNKTMLNLQKAVDGFSFGKIHNWTDGEFSKPGGIRKPCPRLFNSFTVLVNGDISLCCLDYQGSQILGHLDEKTTIHQIWHSLSYQNVRKLHKTCQHSKLPICNECSKAFI